MNTSIVLALDAHKKADGTYPVVLRISHYQKMGQIILGVNLKAEDWDMKSRKVKSSYRGTQSVNRLNNYLQKKKSEAIDAITKLDERGRLDTLTITEIKKHLEGKSGGESFFAYADSLIEAMTKALQIGNARTYQFTVNVLRAYVHDRDLSFREINYEFLTSFEQEHLSKGNALNGLSVYLRTVRAIFNKAIKSGIIDQDLYPFKTYAIKGTKTRKRAIKLESLVKIEGLVFEPGHTLFHARNYFLLSFYFGGASFVDLAHLKVGYVVDGRINYARQKTATPLSFGIMPEAQVILDYYLTGKGKDDFILPIITTDDTQKQYNQVVDKRRRFNKKLKKIAELCGIDENLTSYVTRHSFATRAKNLGVPVASISELLGHTDIRTTQIYLDSLPSDMLDDHYKKITQLK
jgi:integrase/recombinase XerD